MPNMKSFFLGLITLTTVGNLFLILRSAHQALRQRSFFDLLFLGEMGFMLLCGLAILFVTSRKKQSPPEWPAASMLSFTSCLVLNLAVQSGLMLARHLATPPIILDSLRRILHRG
jgi:hypothetical protein